MSKSQKSLAIVEHSQIEKSNMYIVGKINRLIYGCISEDIAVDEVIITEQQLRHIRERHPEAYKQMKKYVTDALENPDYILEDKHENTGLVIKQIKTENKWGQIVLRLCTSENEAGYKNSIISYWEISDKRLQSYLRNKKILYKKE